jgi:hypothetical protein
MKQIMIRKPDQLNNFFLFDRNCNVNVHAAEERTEAKHGANAGKFSGKFVIIINY